MSVFILYLAIRESPPFYCYRKLKDAIDTNNISVDVLICRDVYPKIWRLTGFFKIIIIIPKIIIIVIFLTP